MLELLLVLLIVGILGVVGWLAYDRIGMNRSSVATPASTASVTSIKVTSPDGEVSLRLPSNWHVMKDASNAVLGPDTTKNSGCLSESDPNKCLYMADFFPNSYRAGTEPANGTNPQADEADFWTLKIEQLHGSEANTISFAPPNLIAQNNTPVNGYTAHFVKGYYCTPRTDQCGMAFYDIQHAGYLAEFEENLSPTSGQENPYTLNSATDAEFTQIAQSLRFNF